MARNYVYYNFWSLSSFWQWNEMIVDKVVVWGFQVNLQKCNIILEYKKQKTVKQISEKDECFYHWLLFSVNFQLNPFNMQHPSSELSVTVNIS